MDKRGIVHIELSAKDGKAAASWYNHLFGWDEMYDENMDYAMFNTETVGGGFTTISETTPAGTILCYIDSPDIEADLKKIVDLGGKVMMPKTEIPTVGHFAVFADPEGNTLALYTSMNPPEAA